MPGDVVQLKEGDQIPADVRMVDSVAFACEEAILTGESVAVRTHTNIVRVSAYGAVRRNPPTPLPHHPPLQVSKTADVLLRDPRGDSPPLGDRKNMGFFGCVASRGRGTAVVTATGMSTELGRIATSIGCVCLSVCSGNSVDCVALMLM